MSPPDGPNRPTTEKPALTSALIVVTMVQVQKAMTRVWPLAPDRQVRQDFKLRHYQKRRLTLGCFSCGLGADGDQFLRHGRMDRDRRVELRLGGADLQGDGDKLHHLAR